MGHTEINLGVFNKPMKCVSEMREDRWKQKIRTLECTLIKSTVQQYVDEEDD